MKKCNLHNLCNYERGVHGIVWITQHAISCASYDDWGFFATFFSLVLFMHFFDDYHFILHCWPGWIKKPNGVEWCLDMCNVLQIQPKNIFITFHWSACDCVHDDQIQDSMKSGMHGNVHNDDGTFCSMKSVVQMNCATRRLNLFFQWSGVQWLVHNGDRIHLSGLQCVMHYHLQIQWEVCMVRCAIDKAHQIL